MDIHRCRFVSYAPAAINALAFNIAVEDTRSNKTKDQSHLGVRLAVGRANGDIEIWNPFNGAWLQETIFYGGKDRSVEGLAWIEEHEDEGEDGEEGGVMVNGSSAITSATTRSMQIRYRLFSIGYSSTVTEWDLARGLPRRHSSGNHSEVWCLAAQPKWQTGMAIREGEFRGQNIVAGCADGTLVVLSTADDSLSFQRFLSRSTAKRARVLSVTFQNRDVVVAGFADSLIRVYDFRSGSNIRSISFGGGPLGGPREVLVWAVKCLPNGMIISGDSTGEVRFFDGQTYSQTQRLSAHEADVLDVAISADGKTAFSCGLDRRVVTYRLEFTDGSTPRWVKVSRQTSHKHDIKTLAVHEGGKLSVAVSGGVDTNLNIIPLRGQGIENARTISGLPQRPVIQSAPYARLIASWWDREVHIWRIGSEAQHEKPRQKVARMLLKGEENVSSVSISADGTLLAVATAAGVRTFQLLLKGPEGKSSLKIRKIETPDSVANQGARLLQFSPDGKWLAIITHENKILLTRINRSSVAKPKFRMLTTILRLSRNKRSSEKLLSAEKASLSYLHTMNRIAFSPDSSVLIVSDLSGYLDSWALKGYEDTTGAVADDVKKDSSSDNNDSGDSGDGDEDNENEKSDTVVCGQRWIRNPCGHKLPRVDSAPIVLSFRPFNQGDVKRYHKNTAIDSSRSNSNALLYQLPRGERYIFILTARHRMYEFGVMSGRLSNWSRNNPSKNLPPGFRRIRDRAMGCIWDIQEREGKKRERIWLYGNSWLSMFDLSHDFATTRSTGSIAVQRDIEMNGIKKKELSKIDISRKRSSTAEGYDNNYNGQESGAGSKIPHAQLRGIGQKMCKSVGPNQFAAETVWLDGTNDGALSSNEDDYDDDGIIGYNSNTNYMNGNRAYVNGITHDGDAVLTNGKDEDLDHHVKDDVMDGDQSGDSDDVGKRSAKWHCVYKYRPILGAVVLGDVSGMKASGQTETEGKIEKASKRQKLINGNISERERRGEKEESETGRMRFMLPEVVILERPLWDLDLPQRFVGTHEREQ